MSDAADYTKYKIAIMIPCYNEGLTIKKVVQDFRNVLPSANIYVFDNNSEDNTREEALSADAQVVFVPSKGKGNVVRSMFREVNADIYIMVDGDNTYPANDVEKLIKPIIYEHADMVVGTRLYEHSRHAFRSFHLFGNRLIVSLVNLLFKARNTDILSGYRAFNYRFVKTMPVLSKGFEIETEMTLHALDNRLNIKEVPIKYGVRPEGSESKLNTFRDGWLLIRTIITIFKDYKPLFFFGISGAIEILLGLIAGGFVINEFLLTSKVIHPSTAVLAASLVIVGLLSITTGLILDTLNRRTREQYILFSDHILNKKE